MSLKKSQEIIWQLQSYPRNYIKLTLFLMVGLLFPIYLLSHILIISIILAFSIEIIIRILLYVIWMFIITVIFLPLSASLYSIFHFTIKFTESDLFVKPELLVGTKSYKLSTLSQIEIISGYRYFFDRRRISGLKILMKIITLNGEIKKKYLFAREFNMKRKNMHSSEQIKSHLTLLREDFENHFRNLKILFPNKISLMDEDFSLSYWQMGAGFSRRNVLFFSFWVTYLLLCSTLFLIL